MQEKAQRKNNWSYIQFRRFDTFVSHLFALFFGEISIDKNTLVLYIDTMYVSTAISEI